MHTACTVLLVDNDPTLNAVFTTVLRKAGYTVLSAPNATEALDILRANTIHAIITDLHMPREEGAELLAQIATSKNPIPGILITGSGELEEKFSHAPGVSAMLIKPIVRDTLLRTLERVLAQKKSGSLFPPS